MMGNELRVSCVFWVFIARFCSGVNAAFSAAVKVFCGFAGVIGGMMVLRPSRRLTMLRLGNPVMLMVSSQASAVTATSCSEFRYAAFWLIPAFFPIRALASLCTRNTLIDPENANDQLRSTLAGTACFSASVLACDARYFSSILVLALAVTNVVENFCRKSGDSSRPGRKLISSVSSVSFLTRASLNPTLQSRAPAANDWVKLVTFS